ncbi:MAG: hypothetical protein CL933_07270 [Deltaproteobacteria bacterium]|nr:hypothetical protein [Deltaproteobacteria bacterium]
MPSRRRVVRSRRTFLAQSIFFFATSATFAARLFGLSEKGDLSRGRIAAFRPDGLIRPPTPPIATTGLQAELHSLRTLRHRM